MTIDKLSEFASDGQKDVDDLVLTDGFPVTRKPARQWFNWLFNTLTSKINEIIDADFMPKSDVVDNLTTNDATKPVSAKQAKLLQDNKLDKTANAVSATKLQTARTISGVAFDGTANINLPTASTSTSGTVQLNNTLTSTSTTQALTAAQGKALQDGKLGRSENAVSASQLQTARTIGGVSFNGTANINLPGVNTSGNQNTSGNAATATTATTATTAANCSRSIVAGNGLSGGGALTANRTLTLGTPGTVTASTTNSTTSTGHTHDLNIDGFFQGTKSTNGYQRLPGGLILQWGTSSSSEYSGVVSFPIPFPSAVLMATVGETKSDTSGPTFSFAWNRGGTTKSNLAWQSTGNPGLFSWFAIGY